MSIKPIFLILFLLVSTASQAALNLPQGMSAGEQEYILQTLGFGSSFRSVDNPYPLGGYSGFEFGVSGEQIPSEEIGYLGNQSTIDRNVTYPRISIGKGILSSVDLFFSFLPYSENTGVGIYSGALRWGFFQASFFPACFSLLLHATNTNVNNLFISETLGLDLISGVNADPFSIYVGIGSLYGEGQFDASLSSDSRAQNRVARTFHTLVGINAEFENVFGAFQIDNYNASVFSLKVGVRL